MLIFMMRRVIKLVIQKNNKLVLLLILLPILFLSYITVKEKGWWSVPYIVGLSVSITFLIIEFSFRGYMLGTFDTVDKFKEVLSNSVDEILNTSEETEVVNVTIQAPPASARVGAAGAQVIAATGIESQEAFGTPTVTQDLPTIHAEQNITLPMFSQTATGTVSGNSDEAKFRAMIFEVLEELDIYKTEAPFGRRGRPRFEDDIWAENELKKGRDKVEVRREWMEREGVMARDLIAPEKHFDRIVRRARCE